MDHYLRTTNQADMHKQIAYWKQWPSLESLTQVSSKTLVLKRWKLFSKQEWTN
ncbi:putative PB1-F2 protein [Influenza A virus]